MTFATFLPRDGKTAESVARPIKGKRVSHIGPPKSPSTIMRRASPERGENRGPGKDFLKSLTSGPELENSLGRMRSSAARIASSAIGGGAELKLVSEP
jgi:hypothetical protein